MQKLIRKSVIPTTIIAIFLIGLFFICYKESIASYRKNPRYDAWTSFKMENGKRVLFDNLQYLAAKIRVFGTTQQEIKEKLNDQNIQFFELSVPDANLRSLQADLPRSGDAYVNGKMSVPNGSTEQIKLKFRGDNYYHWGFTKKSMKVKLPNDRTLNLINPKEINFIADKIAFDLAVNMGLFAPNTDFAGVFINNSFKGIYLLTEDVNDDYIDQTNFDAIFSGDNVSESAKSGLGLFQDPNKWNLTAGYLPRNSMTSLLKPLNNLDYQKLERRFDIDYVINFYSFVSIIHNSHYDTTHNWFFGIRNSKFYPIVWDPVGWVMNYQSGNGVEEEKSLISETLRSNVGFNQRFIEHLWKLVGDERLSQSIFTDIDTETDRLLPVLDFDFAKGGIFDNQKGTRSPQSTGEILQQIDLLKEEVTSRFNFLRTELPKFSGSYFFDQQSGYLYIQYLGISGSKIDQLFQSVTFSNYQTLEVFNNQSFRPLPSNIDFLFSSRRKDVNTSPHPYAALCQTTFRIKLTQAQADQLQPAITNMITNQTIPLVKSDLVPITDCPMNFDSLSSVTSDSPPNDQGLITNAPVASLPVLSVETLKPDQSIFLRSNKTEKIDITTGYKDQKNIQGILSKKANSHDVFIELKDLLIAGRQRLILHKVDLATLSTPLLSQLKHQLNLPIAEPELISLISNGYYIDQYFLQNSYLDKSFYETQQMTFDTNIYENNGKDTTKVKNWKKISTDATEKKKDTPDLDNFLSQLDKESVIRDSIDWDNLNHFYQYTRLTGQKSPEYVLYFDNTSGRFKFIPISDALYVTSANEDFSDSLLSRILSFPSIRAELDNNLISESKKIDLKSIAEKTDVFYDGHLDDIWASFQRRLMDVQFAQEVYNSQNALLRKNVEMFSTKDPTTVDTVERAATTDQSLKPDSIFTQEPNNQLRLKAGSYNIKHSIVIPAGYQVTFDQGVHLKLSENISMLSYSPVHLNGTSDDPIILEAKDPDKPWGVFALEGNGVEGSKIDYSEFSDGFEAHINNIYFSGMLSVYHANNVTVRNSSFKNAHADDAVNFKYSNSSIYDSLFEDNSADAIDFDYMSGEVMGNIFINNGNDSVDTSGSTTVIANNYIEKSGDKCLSFGENSHTTAENNILYGCNIGIESKDTSNPTIHNNVFYKNKVALNAYQKKEFFGPSYPTITNSIFIQNGKDITLVNSFVSEKFDTDDSSISVSNSIFDSYSSVDEINQKRNLLDKSIYDLAAQNHWSIRNNSGTIGLKTSDILPKLP